MSMSQFAHELRCHHCGTTHGTERWPRSGDRVPFYFQDEPGQHTLTVECPRCKRAWYVVWDQDPGPIEPLELVLRAPKRPDMVPSAREHHQRGYEHYEKGELDEAIAEYEQALRLDPDLDLTRQFLGEAHQGRGNLDEAIRVWEELLSRGPTTAGVRCVTEGLLTEARAMREELAKDATQAEAELGSYIEQLGQATQTWSVAASALERLGAKAVPALVAAVDSPNDLLRSRSIDVLSRIGDERAIAALQQAAEIDQKGFCRIIGVPEATKTTKKSVMGLNIELPVSDLWEEYREYARNALGAIQERHPGAAALPAPPQSAPSPSGAAPPHSAAKQGCVVAAITAAFIAAGAICAVWQWIA